MNTEFFKNQMTTEFIYNSSRILIRIPTLLSNHSDDNEILIKSDKYGFFQVLDDRRIRINSSRILLRILILVSNHSNDYGIRVHIRFQAS